MRTRQLDARIRLGAWRALALGAWLGSGVSGCGVATGGQEMGSEGPGRRAGKADGESDALVEVGPLEPGRTAIAGAAAYRVESHGGTKLVLSLDGGALEVEGPLAGAGDDVPVGAAARVAAGDGRLEVVLADKGVYRVIARAQSGTLTAACAAACERRAVPLPALIAEARDTGRLDATLGLLEQTLATYIPDPELRARLEAELRGAVARADRAALERFPTIPLAAISTLRPALGLAPAHEPVADRRVEGELAALLGPCKADRSPGAPIDPRLPGVVYGHYPNRALTACQAAHSERLAQVLTSLAVGSDSVVRYRGAELRTPAELVRALLASGHRIEVRNERTYANFLSAALVDRDADLRWPVWVDSGLAMPTGGTLAVPVGHSQHAWRITGPDVDARVMFFLGMYGAAFFGQTSVRPGWTGERASEVTTDRARVVDTIDVSARYLARNRVERVTVARGMPADGYGFLGVCNDSNAVVERATAGTVTTFPLLRARAADATLADGLDDVVRGLPHDADDVLDRADVLRRVLDMSPHALGSDRIWDVTLRAQLSEAAQELGR